MMMSESDHLPKTFIIRHTHSRSGGGCPDTETTDPFKHLWEFRGVSSIPQKACKGRSGQETVRHETGKRTEAPVIVEWLENIIA